MPLSIWWREMEERREMKETIRKGTEFALTWIWTLCSHLTCWYSIFLKFWILIKSSLIWSASIHLFPFGLIWFYCEVVNHSDNQSKFDIGTDHSFPFNLSIQSENRSAKKRTWKTKRIAILIEIVDINLIRWYIVLLLPVQFIKWQMMK
jgi:hypothetical protein